MRTGSAYVRPVILFAVGSVLIWPRSVLTVGLVAMFALVSLTVMGDGVGVQEAKRPVRIHANRYRQTPNIAENVITSVQKVRSVLQAYVSAHKGRCLVVALVAISRTMMLTVGDVTKCAAPTRSAARGAVQPVLLGRQSVESNVSILQAIHNIVVCVVVVV